MAPIGSVIKNGLLFLILLIPIAYFGARLIAFGFIDLMYAATDDSGEITARPSDGSDLPHQDFFNAGIYELALGVLLIFGVGGLVFMKSLSDSVEDGMVEF